MIPGGSYHASLPDSVCVPLTVLTADEFYMSPCLLQSHAEENPDAKISKIWTHSWKSWHWLWFLLFPFNITIHGLEITKEVHPLTLPSMPAGSFRRRLTLGSVSETLQKSCWIQEESVTTLFSSKLLYISKACLPLLTLEHSQKEHAYGLLKISTAQVLTKLK